jgi:hypothetical protein
MRAVAGKVFTGVAVWVALIAAGSAQQRMTTGGPTDPRVGLGAGLHDAEEAAWNMEKIVTMAKPDGFFNPENPKGEPSGPERTPEEMAEMAAKAKAEEARRIAAGEPLPPIPNVLSYTNSDLAFRGNHVIVGNYHGFNTYDIENTRNPRLIASVVCPGGQGDVSVHGNLLFMSVEQTRGRIDCGVEGVPDPVSAERFRGIRIFDITDVSRPRQVAAVQTCRGSHTHSLVTNPKDPANIYIYNSGTSSPRSGEELEGCVDAGPDDPDTALFSIDVIHVPVAAPGQARIVNRPRIFADESTGNIAGLWQGGDHGPGTQSSRMTNQCHDITVYPEIGLAAGACSGNGILLDISDPVNPTRLDSVVDKTFAYWHSATFNNDGTKVVFTDEWGGGGRPRCRATDPLEWGANAIFDIVDGKLVFRSYYKMPAPQTEQENCVAHNGSLIPVPGRDIMVQAWYQGGLSVFDFTDSSQPFEIAYFDRGPVDAEHLMSGGYWSTYWYNGHIYGAEIARGLDIFRLVPSEHLTQNEIDAASQIRLSTFNVQEQPKIEWPATSQVARAYLDQLRRSNALTVARRESLNTLLDRVDQLRTGREASAPAILKEIEAAAREFEQGAAKASGQDQRRMRALSENLAARAARLR